MSAPQKPVDELLNGSGCHWFRQLFDNAQVAEARAILHAEISRSEDKVTHFQGGAGDKVHLQKRVWNLLNKGDVFVDMVQQPQVLDTVGELLGDEFILGSIAANVILPGGPGQEPHIDYPYWDLYKRDSFPAGINNSFALNCQATILLDDFTQENGATSYVPGTQQHCRYPDENDNFHGQSQRMTGAAGDVVLFNGMVWHCAMPNNSDKARAAILIQYLPKFVKPMEDPGAVDSSVIAAATPALRQLLGFNYPYPQLLDEQAAGNTEGRTQ